MRLPMDGSSKTQTNHEPAAKALERDATKASEAGPDALHGLLDLFLVQTSLARTH